MSLPLSLERARAEDPPALAALEAACHSHPWTESQLQEEVSYGSPGAVLVLRGRARPRERWGGVRAYCVYRLIVDEERKGGLRELVGGDGTRAQARLTAETIDGVTRDLERTRLNTAISKLMVWSNEITADGPLPRKAAEVFLLMLSPFAPHLAEELWNRLGHTESLALEPWPISDQSCYLHFYQSLPSLQPQIHFRV